MKTTAEHCAPLVGLYSWVLLLILILGHLSVLYMHHTLELSMLRERHVYCGEIGSTSTQTRATTPIWIRSDCTELRTP